MSCHTQAWLVCINVYTRAATHRLYLYAYMHVCMSYNTQASLVCIHAHTLVCMSCHTYDLLVCVYACMHAFCLHVCSCTYERAYTCMRSCTIIFNIPKNYCPLVACMQILFDHRKYLKLFAFEWARKKNKAELISRSQTFGFHMEDFPNALFKQEISSAVCLVRSNSNANSRSLRNQPKVCSCMCTR